MKTEDSVLIHFHNVFLRNNNSILGEPDLYNKGTEEQKEYQRR